MYCFDDIQVTDPADHDTDSDPVIGLIGLEQAKKDALVEYGFDESDVQILKEEFNVDKKKYSIEYIATDSTDSKQYQYDCEINAVDGSVLYKDKQVVSE